MHLDPIVFNICLFALWPLFSDGGYSATLLLEDKVI
jgi:hypothetical protein